MVFGDRIVVLLRLQQQHVLDVLLGQRGTALSGALLHVGRHERTHHALDIHAACRKKRRSSRETTAWRIGLEIFFNGTTIRFCA